MKLLTKNSIYFLVITSIVFLIGGYIFYHQLQKIMNEEATEELYNAKKVFVDYIIRSKTLPGSMVSMHDVRFELVPAKIREKLFDTTYVEESTGEVYPMKQLYYPVQLSANNSVYNYRGVVGKSMMESDDLIETISWSFLIIMIVLITILIISNYIYSKIAWKPFHSLLDAINNYDMHKHKIISPINSNTTEFVQLAGAINRMTKKIDSDFQSMRSFTENASHEIQTPLAIIKTKSELLLQDPKLNEEEKKEIYEINQTAGRLSKLNQTLLMFAKIENDQYHEKEKLDIGQIINNKLEQYEDLFVMKKIKVVQKLKQKVTIEMNPVLLEMVISNLLTNALKHSSERSEVVIELSDKIFSVSNTGGSPLNIEPSKLFERFFKIGDTISSTGLGLALVKQIALMNNHAINYDHKNNQHIFNYNF